MCPVNTTYHCRLFDATLTGTLHPALRLIKNDPVLFRYKRNQIPLAVPDYADDNYPAREWPGRFHSGKKQPLARCLLVTSRPAGKTKYPRGEFHLKPGTFSGFPRFRDGNAGDRQDFTGEEESKAGIFSKASHKNLIFIRVGNA